MTESTELITLEHWARVKYGNKAPSIGTLRRWAREAHIYPAPEKHGRTWFLTPDAKYQNHAFGSSAHAGLFQSVRRRRNLLDTINGSKTS